MNETVIATSCSGGTCTELVRGTDCFTTSGEGPTGIIVPAPGTHYYTRTSNPVE